MKRSSYRSWIHISRWSLALLFVIIAFPGISPAMNGAHLYEKYSPGVVVVVARGEGGIGEVGTGFVINGKGYVVTCAHTIIDESRNLPYENVKIYFKPSRVTGAPSRDLINGYNGAAVAVDSRLDLALVRVDGYRGNYVPVPLADFNVPVGENVVSIGHPEGAGLWAFTSGVVSGEVEGQFGITGRDVYQTDIIFGKGSSGSPLINGEGYAVGMVLGSPGCGEPYSVGRTAFALKSAVIARWIETKGVSISRVPRSRVGQALEGEETIKRTEEELENLIEEMREKLRDKRKRVTESADESY